MLNLCYFIQEKYQNDWAPRQRTACQNTECAALERNWCDSHKYPPICMRCDGENKITFGHCRKHWKFTTTNNNIFKPLPEFDIKYEIFTDFWKKYILYGYFFENNKLKILVYVDFIPVAGGYIYCTYSSREILVLYLTSLTSFWVL